MIVFTVIGYLAALAFCFGVGYELGPVYDMTAQVIRVARSMKATQRALVAVVVSMEEHGVRVERRNK
jgi:hypothetical protein